MTSARPVSRWCGDTSDERRIWSAKMAAWAAPPSRSRGARSTKESAGFPGGRGRRLRVLWVAASGMMSVASMRPASPGTLQTPGPRPGVSGACAMDVRNSGYSARRSHVVRPEVERRGASSGSQTWPSHAARTRSTARFRSGSSVPLEVPVRDTPNVARRGTGPAKRDRAPSRERASVRPRAGRTRPCHPSPVGSAATSCRSGPGSHPMRRPSDARSARDPSSRW